MEENPPKPSQNTKASKKKTYRSKLLQGPHEITPRGLQTPLHILRPDDLLAHLVPLLIDLLVRRSIHVIRLEISVRCHRCPVNALLHSCLPQSDGYVLWFASGGDFTVEEVLACLRSGIMEKEVIFRKRRRCGELDTYICELSR